MTIEPLPSDFVRADPQAPDPHDLAAADEECERFRRVFREWCRNDAIYQQHRLAVCVRFDEEGILDRLRLTVAELGFSQNDIEDYREFRDASTTSTPRQHLRRGMASLRHYVLTTGIDMRLVFLSFRWGFGVGEQTDESTE